MQLLSRTLFEASVKDLFKDQSPVTNKEKFWNDLMNIVSVSTVNDTEEIKDFLVDLAEKHEDSDEPAFTTVELHKVLEPDQFRSYRENLELFNKNIDKFLSDYDVDHKYVYDMIHYIWFCQHYFPSLDMSMERRAFISKL